MRGDVADGYREPTSRWALVDAGFAEDLDSLFTHAALSTILVFESSPDIHYTLSPKVVILAEVWCIDRSTGGAPRRWFWKRG